MRQTHRFYLVLFMSIVNCFVFVGMSLANPISRQQALQNAQAFLNAKGKNIPQSSLRNDPSVSTTTAPESYYVFNIGDNAGYVIAAGNDCVPAILGYADAGAVDPNNMPSNMKAWLEEYASQIKYMQENGLSSADEPVLTANHPAISPLLTTTWDQDDPYNQNCPDFFTYGKCVTGCVATAMAQVMYYHRFNSVTATTATIPAYDCKKNWTSSGETLGHIHVDAIPAGSFIDWDNMLDSYDGSTTTIQQQAVANLMKYCGAAVQMDYADAWNGGSGAYSSDVPEALKNYFNYSEATVLKKRSSYTSNNEWDDLIYSELASSRPVYYSGSNNSGGHAFVCDGYDGNGYYHINWGWSGTSNGNFLLSALDPHEQGTGGSSAGYNNNQAALIYAEPKGGTPPIVSGITFADSNVESLCLSNWDSNGDGQLTMTEAAAVTTLGNVFKNNTSIRSFNELQYFTGLISLAASAFEGCTALATVTIPANVTAINSSVFKNCTDLSSIIIPSKVTTIGSNAFYGCSSLTTIRIPASVTSISSGAFSCCSGLADMTVASGNTIYHSGNNCKAIIETNSNQLVAGCKNTIIPITVTSIDSYAFQGMTGLTVITIPSSVSSIGSYAFDGCSALTSVTIGNTTPVAITSTVFSNRANATLYVPAGTKSAYQAANCWKEFKEIIEQTTPSSNNIIFADANVKALCVQNWDTNGDGELSETEAAAVTDLGSVFRFNSTITYFDELQHFTGLSGLGNYAFSGCSRLTSVTIPSSVTSIGSQAFGFCEKLTSVTIPSSVTSIGDDAFGGCYGLTSMTIPSSVTNIGNSAFLECRGLTSITIPSSVTSIGRSAFANCYGLTSISVNSSNTVYDSRNNCNAIIEKATNTLIAGCKNTIIPSSVTCIGDCAFSGSIGLISITIPSNVTSIGDFAFFGCHGLTSITIPSGVASIGECAFKNCIGLTSVTIPSSVTSIGYQTFLGCYGLTNLKVDLETPLSIGFDTFSNRENAALYVPVGSGTSYSNASYWKEFKRIIEFVEGDVNGDGESDVVDVVDIARYVVGTPAEAFVPILADLDNSGEVNIGDAVALVNEIAGDQNFVKAMRAPSRAAESEDVLSLTQTDEGLALVLANQRDYTAFQFDLFVPDGTDVARMLLNAQRKQKHQLLYNKVEEGHYRVAALSTSNRTFQGNDGELLNFSLEGAASGDVTIRNIHFFDTKGGDYMFNEILYEGTTTGIADTPSATPMDGAFYTIDGRRIGEKPTTKGLYIVNGKKVVIK